MDKVELKVKREVLDFELGRIRRGEGKRLLLCLIRSTYWRCGWHGRRWPRWLDTPGGDDRADALAKTQSAFQVGLDCAKVELAEFA
jgi:hypothetical protein